jgi:hypothetical protein
VTFFDGATPLGNRPLSGGGATFTASSLAVGPHSITAAYSGDADFAAGISSVLTETIEDFSFSISSVSVTAPSNGTAILGVTFTPVSLTTFPASVALSTSGLPAGATTTFSSPRLPAGSAATSETVTVQLPAATAALNRERDAGQAGAVRSCPAAASLRWMYAEKRKALWPHDVSAAVARRGHLNDGRTDRLRR